MSSAAATFPLEQVVWRPKVNPWLIGATVSIAAFVVVLDTSVANVALPYIAGGLGASYDDSTWVLTSYLAANAIILPMSGWLAEIIGRKRYFMLSLAIFTVSSLLCGLAPSLPVLLFFRALQGIGGGGGGIVLFCDQPIDRFGQQCELIGRRERFLADGLKTDSLRIGRGNPMGQFKQFVFGRALFPQAVAIKHGQL